MSVGNIVLSVLVSVCLLEAYFSIHVNAASDVKNAKRSGLPAKITGVRFLVTVNDTWDPDGCIATVATPMLKPGKKYNESEQITVGSCDHGPLVFDVNSANDGVNVYNLFLTFHSSVIEDASPPTCTIAWNGTYLVPRKPWPPNQNLLPSCFTMESREGYHMTYYWFNILEWM